MNRYLAFLSLSFFALLLSLTIVLPVFAEEFAISHIGGMATQGKKFNQWWYEPQRVVLKGTAPKESNIALTFDNKTETIKVNSDGNWTFDMGTLEIADHAVSLTSGINSYKFLLSIGSAPPANMNGDTKSGLPEAGGILPLIGIVGVAGALIFYSLKKKDL